MQEAQTTCGHDNQRVESKDRGLGPVNGEYRLCELTAEIEAQGVDESLPPALFLFDTCEDRIVSGGVLAFTRDKVARKPCDFVLPYTLTQAGHLRAILEATGLNDANGYERRGTLRHALCCCPLCTRFIRYSELHQIVTFSGEDSILGFLPTRLINQ